MVPDGTEACPVAPKRLYQPRLPPQPEAVALNPMADLGGRRGELEIDPGPPCPLVTLAYRASWWLHIWTGGGKGACDGLSLRPRRHGPATLVNFDVATRSKRPSHDQKRVKARRI